MGRDFEDCRIQSLSPPIFVALTSHKGKQYQGKPALGSTGPAIYFFNPDIPQLSEYSQNKKPHTKQTATTNSARIAAEFHDLVIPKVEPADRVPIAALKIKTQPKKKKQT
ncbi:hypothetical protein C1H46_003878 [Malus baccata]|uniref:Uncharacterized protein n=1 Tax=Malus baccata TaxID=106549 RepID=A0A540NJ77_MALBA|nr:hypothetical protein C1H46_003878 [Malus baccata]